MYVSEQTRVDGGTNGRLVGSWAAGGRRRPADQASRQDSRRLAGGGRGTRLWCGVMLASVLVVVWQWNGRSV